MTATTSPSRPSNRIEKSPKVLMVVAGRVFADRLRFTLVLGAGLAAFSAVAFLISSSTGGSIDDITKDLPEAFDALLGAAGGTNYIVSEIFGLIAPVLLLVLAISSGVQAVAGEERDHTAALLLAQPVQRRDLVIAKGAVLIGHLLIATTIFGASFALFDGVLDGGVDVGNAVAATVHLFALALAFGMFALALSSWTGSTSLSNGIAAGLAVAANLVAGVLPLAKDLAGGAKASPWYYYNGSDPLTNGLDPLHVVILLSLAGVGFAVALAGVTRRDVDSGQHGSGLAIPALDRLTAPHIRSIFSKTLSERIVLLAVACGSIASMAVLVSLMFDGLQQTMADFSENLPEAMSRAIGGADLGTAVGWIDAEMVAILLPLVVIGVAVNMGVGAIAGEADRHTLALLLAAPISRRRVVVEKAAAVAVVVAVIAVVSGLSILAGSALGGLGLDTANIAGTSAHLAMIGLLFGAIALALGAMTDKQAATRATVAIAVMSYVVAAFLPSASALEPFAKLSPWYYFDSSQPLANGADPVHLSVLAALTAVAFVAALVLVDRRDVEA